MLHTYKAKSVRVEQETAKESLTERANRVPAHGLLDDGSDIDQLLEVVERG